jgi:hypothetical protein
MNNQIGRPGYFFCGYFGASKGKRIRQVYKRDKGNSGQGLVEFALIVPIVLVFLFGTVEFGRAWMMSNILAGDAGEAVRIYAVISYEYSVAASRAKGILSSPGLSPDRPRITHLFPLPPTCEGNNAGGDRIE